MSGSGASLVLFDIDGTLVLTGRAGVRAMEATFLALFGVPDAFAGVSMGGRTDSWLLSQALARHGLVETPEVHARFRDAYIPRLAAEIALPGTGTKGIMPGVAALLSEAVAHPRLHVALLTGNYRAAAQVKLAHFGLWDYFPFGAFSDDAADRNLLVPVAQARAETAGLTRDAYVRVVVIGDTPHDIACAAVAGARSIAVATGAHSVAELRAAGANVVLEDLTATGEVIDLLL